jgi:hypothetical protein
MIGREILNDIDTRVRHVTNAPSDTDRVQGVNNDVVTLADSLAEVASTLMVGML